MSKITKRGWIEIGACTGAFVVLAIIAGFFDLQINKALYNPASLYGQFFAKLGELPSYLAAPFVGAVFFHQSIKGKTQNILWKIVSVLIVFGGWMFAIGHWFWKNFVISELDFAIIYKLFFSAFMSAVTILSMIKIDKDVMKKLFVLAIFIAVVVALSNLIVQIMKILWSRQRFRTMVDIEKNAQILAYYGKDFKGFAPWYKPEFLFKSGRTEAYISSHKAVDSDTFKSFPSGHTVAAAASFVIVILPEMYSELKKYRWMFWVFPAIYTVLVAISRIVMGAHYLSDVLFGGFIGFAVAALIRWLAVGYKDGKLLKTFD